MIKLSESEMASIDLPKWPNLRVQGEDISIEQAAEIIIRTSGLYFGCNDKAWNKDVGKLFEIKQTKEMWYPFAYEKDLEKFKVLDLQYLANHQISSSYINGPHGWVSWNGEVSCYGFNIGKWPSTIAVFDEWKIIAKAFPFLNLRCQLMSGDSYTENIRPLIGYEVANGHVSAYISEEVLGEELFPEHRGSKYDDDNFEHFNKFGSERGCTLEFLKNALHIFKKKYDIE